MHIYSDFIRKVMLSLMTCPLLLGFDKQNDALVSACVHLLNFTSKMMFSLMTCAHLLRFHKQNDALANDLCTFIEISCAK